MALINVKGHEDCLLTAEKLKELTMGKWLKFPMKPQKKWKTDSKSPKWLKDQINQGLYKPRPRKDTGRKR